MHRWLAEDEEDGKTEIELEPSDITEKDKSMFPDSATYFEDYLFSNTVRKSKYFSNIFYELTQACLNAQLMM